MFENVLKRLFGSANEREIKKLAPLVKRVNSYEPTFEALTDAELREKTFEFKNRLSDGQTLDDILPEAFAVVREASKRVLGMRHFDVQLMGGMILHKGMVAEMMTGEGKTLVATLPSYLNALTGKGVHVVTVNDYLAKRDADWMGRIHRFLGLEVGCIVHELTDMERRHAYACDITYGTNNELGFDYLRDNMKFRRQDMVQRDFNYAIVDEVDSILIDEARTPLIISGPAEDSSELYKIINTVIPHLTTEHYEKDEKSRAVTLTEAGSEKIEELLSTMGLIKGKSLYEPQNVSLVHHVNQALRAHVVFTRDVDYIVKDDKIVIIDEFTGRMMEGRRYSEGQHQALEAKEGVTVQMENQTLASITFQNYFRLYVKLSGMTGTAMTEASELGDIYKLEVVNVPTNVPLARIDQDDEVYRTAREKYEAIIKLIQECRERQQPVLVGTTSIEKSELASRLLTQAGIPHQVLNARYHEQEAKIISQAGAPGAVTVATNMAGRGTDIKLGGNVDALLEETLQGVEDEAKRTEIEAKIRAQVKEAERLVKESGGLFVLGTERHESRRIDNQLRGRSGRQGDPGRSRFFLSLEDDLMRIFGSERLDSMLQKLGLEEGEAIVHKWINKALERAQQKVEARNYDIRKHLLKYDDVMNDQRKVIYGQRRELMDTEDASEEVLAMQEDVVENLVGRCIPDGAYADQWDTSTLHEEALRVLNLDLPVAKWAEEEGIAEGEIQDRLMDALSKKMEGKERNYGAHVMRAAEKSILLRVLDQAWKEHLLALDHLRQGINLRAYAQRDPLNEYKHEAFLQFQEMLGRVREMVVTALSHLQFEESATPASFEDDYEDVAFEESAITLQGGEDAAPATAPAIENVPTQKPASGPKEHFSVSVGGAVAPPASRNALCPCGSGRRYKQCHGKI
ncbi:MAG: preprotein translocase subunit SecA [Proteobacteria bacterium]|nr:preprotein translocase subunit SecA [Pseudomonadota bacterium]